MKRLVETKDGIGFADPIIIGVHSLIPKGTIVFSIALQKNITFEEDETVEITNIVHGTEDYFFGKLVEIRSLNMPGHLPYKMYKTNGDVGIPFSKTLPIKGGS